MKTNGSIKDLDFMMNVSKDLVKILNCKIQYLTKLIICLNGCLWLD